MPYGYSNGKVCDLEQAKSLSFSDGILLLDGVRIRSYDELVQLASTEKYKNLEFIEVVLLPAIAGG